MKIDDKKIIVFWGKDEKKFEKKEFTKHNIAVHHLKGGHRHIDVKPVIEEINERIEEGANHFRRGFGGQGTQWRNGAMKRVHL
jgi:hypothetical protein